MTKYARDEFDRVPETSTRQGVHRAVSTPRRRSLAPILAAGFAALAVGLVAFLILPKLGFASAGGSSALTAEAAGSSASPAPAAPSPTPSSASPGASAGATTEAPGGSPSASAPAGDTPTAAVQPVDKTQPVTIYNGTTTAGLASRVGGTVSSAGWTLGQLGNWPGARQQTSVIFYSGKAQQGNAEALGTLLGIPTMVQSAEFNAPLVVVLGPGFQ
ncbi:LytR C-terminal domain-containing protein [Pseudarthrobacter albicanus]|uniref:LytR C-terminal domain-containing protein n=1 Tax=Pseudarthrobacter albicanus TaxID=2823873 RepID=UPI001BA626B7|nr:LytR C-terminal domain-containing protein [Pseudarthrobacter albicanus]